MTITYMDPTDYPPLPFWHYRGMDGLPVWFSKMHRAIIQDRASKIAKANSRDGMAMRYCYRCEVPIGVMLHLDYERRYVEREGTCKACGNRVCEMVMER